MWKVAGSILLLGAMAGGLACGGSEERGTTQLPPREAVQAIQVEVEKFSRVFWPVPDEASRVVLDQRERCTGIPAVLGRDLESRVGPAQMNFREAIMVEFSHDDFIRFARRLERIRTTDEKLQRLIVNAGAAAEEAAKAEGHHFDWCEQLKEWQHSGWSEEVEGEIYAEPFRTTGMSREKLEELRADNVEVMPRLQELGLSLSEAAAITAALGPV
jgi:hypothetical protein